MANQMKTLSVCSRSASEQHRVFEIQAPCQSPNIGQHPCFGLDSFHANVLEYQSVAGVVKSVDALDSKSSGPWVHVGSSPTSGILSHIATSALCGFFFNIQPTYMGLQVFSTHSNVSVSQAASMMRTTVLELSVGE